METSVDKPGPTAQAGLPAAGTGWHFGWVESPPDPQRPDEASESGAPLTGRLHWRGLELAFCADGLRGVDGRVSAGSMATVPAELQPLVLQQLADDCLRGLEHGALGELRLSSLAWHEPPQPLHGDFEFTLHRSGSAGRTRVCLVVPPGPARTRLAQALVAAGWPLPAALDAVSGRLRAGSLALTAQELQSLQSGDLVWLDDAQLSPQGLRLQFLPADGQAGCMAWAKHERLTREARPLAGASAPAWQPYGAGSADGAALLRLPVLSPELTVGHSWLNGAAAPQPLPGPLLGATWTAHLAGQPALEGQLMRVARRLGLRITQVPGPTLAAALTSEP